MFKKLLSRFQSIQANKSDHPLISDENLDHLFSDIPRSDPERVLYEVGYWLDAIDRYAAEIGESKLRHAILRLDNFSRPAFVELYARFLKPGSREYLLEQTRVQIDAYVTHLAHAHRHILAAAVGKSGLQDSKTLALCSARGMLAWIIQKKLHRLRYRLPNNNWWQIANELLELAGKHKVHETVQLLYEGEQLRLSARQFHAVGIYFEMAPLGNLARHHFEALDRFLLQQAVNLEVLHNRNSASTHRIDLDANSGPVRITDQDEQGSSMRYCSGTKLRGQLVGLATQLRGDTPLPDWVAEAHCSRDQMQDLVKALVMHWSTSPPRRESSRHDQQQQLRIVHGFRLARRMIAYSGYARSGREIEYESSNSANFGEGRFAQADKTAMSEGGKQPSSEEEIDRPEVTPLDVLENLETSGDIQMMERWQQTDVSVTGFGAVMSGLRSVHGVEGLLCYRHDLDIEWRLGIIRRIGRDARDRASIGIQTLPGTLFCALAKPQGNKGVDAWPSMIALDGHGYADAILLVGDREELVLPLNAFVADLRLDLKAENGRRHVRMIELIAQGNDYQRISIESCDVDDA